jgi:hypothetical protein
MFSQLADGARDMTAETPKITAITPKKLAEILRKSGSREVYDETIAADIEAGAPVAEDGTINMIEYAAWLVREMGRGD